MPVARPGREGWERQCQVICQGRLGTRQAVLDLGMGKSGGEFSGRAFKVTKPREAKDLKYKVRKVPPYAWGMASAWRKLQREGMYVWRWRQIQ